MLGPMFLPVYALSAIKVSSAMQIVSCIMLTLTFTQVCYASGEAIQANSNGYIDSSECATCHAEQYSGFQHVGMSQSFSKARAEWLTQEKAQSLPFYHVNSARYYNIVTQGDGLLFQRYQLDNKSKKINTLTMEIDYLLGSGNKTTSLLFRTQNNELYQLPINWYSEGAFWEMSPGYEQQHHYGLSRQITRECMFCHNAFPQEEMDKDHYWQRDTFPVSLKEGIDCQRCHGPGEPHLKQVRRKDATIDDIRSSIVNPAKLSPEKRDSVCFQCHMLPSVSMVGMRQFQRTDYSFRPGEPLSDYLLHVDIKDEHIPAEHRFEINHHGYRLSQSACFSQSEGALTCISCHNPHKKPPRDEFYRQVDQQCASCHDVEQVRARHQNDVGNQTCVSCHMPQRRAQDVINVVMTEHKIGVFQDRQALQNPLQKKEPVLLDMRLWDDDLDMQQAEKDIYRLTTILQAMPSAKYAEYLKSRLQTTKYPHERPYVLLAETYLKLKQYNEALTLLNFIKTKFGGNFRIEELIATALVATGENSDAEKAYRWLLGLDSENADLYFNFGLLKYKLKQYSEAFDLFDKASVLKDNFAISVMYMAMASYKLNKDAKAMELFIRSLQLDPLLDRSYEYLIRLLHKSGNKVEAKRYYKVALQNLADASDVLGLAEEPDKHYLSAY